MGRRRAQLLLQITPEHVIACGIDDRVQNGVEYAQRRQQKEHVALHNYHLIQAHNYINIHECIFNTSQNSCVQGQFAIFLT